MAFLCCSTVSKILVLPYQHRASNRIHTAYRKLQDIFGRVETKYKSSIPPGGLKSFLKHRDAISHEGTPKVFQPAKELE